MKIVTYDGLKYYHDKVSNYIDEKIQNEKGVFIGTQEDYNTANSAGKIKTGSLVIILDPNELEESTVTALLGTAILGKMILGNK